MTRFLFIFLALSLSAPALARARAAGPGVNNGGGGWGCRIADGSLLWIKTVERFAIERNADPDRKLVKPAGKAEDTVDAYLAYLRKHAAEFSTLLPLNTKEFLGRVYWRKQALPHVDDADLKWKPAKTSCPEGKVEFLQLAIYLGDGTLLMDDALWAHPKMEEVDRAILLFHEMIYKALRDKRGDEASWPTQSIVESFFSESDPQRGLTALQRTLRDGKVPDDKLIGSNVILFAVDLQCFLSSPKGFKDLGAIWAGADITYEDGAYRYRVVTWDDGRPYIMQITDLKTRITARLDDFVLFPTFKERQRVSLELGPEGGYNNAPYGARLLCYNKGTR